MTPLLITIIVLVALVIVTLLSAGFPQVGGIGRQETVDHHADEPRRRHPARPTA